MERSYVNWPGRISREYKDPFYWLGKSPIICRTERGIEWRGSIRGLELSTQDTYRRKSLSPYRNVQAGGGPPLSPRRRRSGAERAWSSTQGVGTRARIHTGEKPSGRSADVWEGDAWRTSFCNNFGSFLLPGNRSYVSGEVDVWTLFSWFSYACIVKKQVQFWCLLSYIFLWNYKTRAIISVFRCLLWVLLRTLPPALLQKWPKVEFEKNKVPKRASSSEGELAV